MTTHHNAPTRGGRIMGMVLAASVVLPTAAPAQSASASADFGHPT